MKGRKIERNNRREPCDEEADRKNPLPNKVMLQPLWDRGSNN